MRERGKNGRKEEEEILKFQDLGVFFEVGVAAAVFLRLREEAPPSVAFVG
jgi:hypothetical protein